MANTTPPILSPRLAVFLLLMIVVLGGLGASRIRLVEDITALLPEQDRDEHSLIDMARRWGMMQKVVVVLSSDEPSSEALHRAVDATASEIERLEGVGAVVSRVEMGEVRRAAEILMERAPRLYRPRKTAINEAEIAARLAGLKSRLAAPEAMIMQPFLLSDPLGFADDALRGLEAAGKAMGATVERQHLISEDRRSALIIVETDFDALDVTLARSFVVALDKTIEKSLSLAGATQLEVTRLGGVHFTASSSGAIISDVRLAFVLTSILVAVIFFFFFRRIQLLPAALLPGGIGIIVAAGLMGLFGVELHALTLGFAATITGISVDYAIHLLHRAQAEPGISTQDRMRRALGAVWRPVALGCLTTTGALLLAATSHFTGIRQLALFAAISIPVAMVVTLFGLPSFHRFLLAGAVKPRKAISPSVREVGKGRRVAAVALFAVFLAAGLALSIRAPLSGDPRDLGSTDARLAAHEKMLRQKFPGLSDQAFLVTSHRSYGAAVEANDLLYESLLEADIAREDIISVSPFLPSPTTQERSQSEALQLFATDGIASVFKAAGFKDEYFVSLRDGARAPVIEPLTYQGSSLRPIIDDAVKSEGDYYHVLTRVRASDEHALERLASIAAGVDGCRLVSERLETKETLSSLQRELVRMLAIWLVAALLLLTAIERSLYFGLKAVLPALFGVAAAAGLFGLLGRPITAVASAGFTLVMGLGIDYGIFMLSRTAGPRHVTAAAVLASATTTIAAFGVLALAETRAMADLGWIILVGVTAALVAALVLLPAISSGDKV